MNDINLINKNNKLLYSFKSAIIPKIGQLIWVDKGTVYYKVIGILYDLNTKHKKMDINIIVE